MAVQEILLKYDMVCVFHSIKHVYGEALFEKFVSYIKKIYNLDPSYDYNDIIDVMYEDEIIFNINVFFDNEDERHILEIGIKDQGLEKLISYLKENFPLTKNYQLENYQNPKTNQEHITAKIKKEQNLAPSSIGQDARFSFLKDGFDSRRRYYLTKGQNC